MNLNKKTFFICLFLSFSFVQLLTAQTSTLTLTIENLNEKKGNLMIAIFKGAENFLKDGQAVASKIVLVETIPTMSVLFPNLPYGEYAIAVYHDKNKNQQLDTNFFGIPSEPYGFSNNAKSKWGPPKYNIAKFHLNQTKKNKVIQVKKWLKQ